MCMSRGVPISALLCVNFSGRTAQMQTPLGTVVPAVAPRTGSEDSKLAGSVASAVGGGGCHYFRRMELAIASGDDSLSSDR